ncbi:hypothetical protein L7F22_057592 [Adiantum nelumboides]|nr:hypothetical protein [Adiantum nelumboides]MCO5603442.1 hypothetical protein [Adiantum nelumboides]
MGTHIAAPLGSTRQHLSVAMADAELWQRHGLTMLLQTTIAVYVVAKCARDWKFVLLSVCLTFLGGINYYYILKGEEQWLRNFLRAGETGYVSNFSDAAKASPGLVTLQDILSSNDLTTQTPSIVLLCVGFAFFKLYKRRLCNLLMYEWRAEKTRELFLGELVFEDMEKLMFVELRFLFDSLYTKAAGTAFSKTGVGFRILTTILLVVSAVFILGGKVDLNDQALKQSRDVTFCLILAALIIEVYQLARLALSDWCRVWLACKYILVGEKYQENSVSGSFCCFCFASVLLKIMKLSSSLGRHKYWTKRIGQYSMFDSGKLST